MDSIDHCCTRCRIQHTHHSRKVTGSNLAVGPTVTNERALKTRMSTSEPPKIVTHFFLAAQLSLAIRRWTDESSSARSRPRTVVRALCECYNLVCRFLGRRSWIAIQHRQPSLPVSMCEKRTTFFPHFQTQGSVTGGWLVVKCPQCEDLDGPASAPMASTRSDRLQSIIGDPVFKTVY